MKDDFLEFITESKKVPDNLFTETRELVRVSLKPKYTVAKFYALQVLGMFLTLFICPQYGFQSVGFSGIADWVMEKGVFVCAIYCSSIFFAGGLAVSYIFLTKGEFNWIYRNRLSLIIPFNSVVFFLMMLTKDMALENHALFHGNTFNITWIFTSFLVALIVTELVKLRSVKFARVGI
jgi:hypothetical protein